MSEQLHYWIGPHGMRVPATIQSVPAVDGANRIHIDGASTKMNIMRPWPTKEDYLNKYAELKNDGHYWYKSSAK